ncbi:MAG TPA: 6-hydroxymethylpterin diphosphokinase MptE-like protein [Syntrophorhabdales bacterium]|nr:6-hydroxymethylpterin diphosphokinase MptE-like protein [Syntrophorhabdales bacterium]
MDYYQKNIEALRQYQPQLVDLIEATEEDGKTVRMLMSEGGEPRLVWKGEDGEESNIHSANDPVHCARQAIDLMDKSEKEGIFVLLGFGLGYLAEELLKHFETGHAMLIYEATPLLFKSALRARDLTRVFASEKVKILVGECADDFSIIHNYNHHMVNGKLWLVAHRPSVRLNETAYATFRERLKDQKRISLANVGTAIGLGKDFINAFLQNVPSLLHNPGVVSLKNLFEGRPAIVVAAGPSLERNVHLLKQAKSRALIVAVDAALPTLVLAGILPDVLVAIDPKSENVGMFRDNPHLKEIPFVCLAQYTPEIVKIYPGPLFVNMTEGNIVYQWLRGHWEEKGCIACFGGSVSHLGFAVAEFMGASTICLTGLDLSFEEKLHAGDTTRLLFPADQEVPDYRIGAESVQDIFGEKRYSLQAYLTFKTSFENRIKTFSGQVFNATEGGLPVAGAENIRLADFIVEFCDVARIDALSRLRGQWECDVTYDLEGLLQEIKSAKAVFMGIRRNAARILVLIHRLIKMKKSGREEDDLFHKTLKEIETLTEKVRHPSLNIIAAYHYQLELYLMKLEIQEIDEIEDKYKRLDEQLQRGLNYYGELLEALPLFLEELGKLQQVLENVERSDRLLMDTSATSLRRLRTVAAIYQKAGMATKAVRCLETALGEANRRHMAKLDGADETRLGQEYRSLYLSLGEGYIEQFRYCEAKEALERTRSHSNSGVRSAADPAIERKIDALLKICEEKIRAWEERELKMALLVKQAESSYGTKLESAFFYFRLGSYERAVKAYLGAVREHSNGQSPQLVAAFYGLAHTYLKLKENQKAVDAFASALQIDPGNPLIYRDLAILAIENGNMDSGEMFLTKALDLAPWSDELYSLLARLYLGLGESGKAIALYEYGLQRNPQNANLQNELALLYQDVVLQSTNQDEHKAG